MITLTSSTENAISPPEPALITCAKCQHIHYIGTAHCPACGARAARPEFHSFEESDEWIEKEYRDTVALARWHAWQRRQSLKTVKPDHPRYAAWGAFRFHLATNCGPLRGCDADIVSHLAAVVILKVRRDAEGLFWFGDVLMDDDLGDDLFAREHDDEDHSIAFALSYLSRLLAEEVGAYDDISPTDHAIIKDAFR